jgi:predicted nucleotide-binding protein
MMLKEATFGLLVMTAEDKHRDGSSHARENVVHEAGLFQGKLGFENAILLVEDGCTLPSNLRGLTYIGFPTGSIRASFHDIERLLKDRRIVRT